MRYLALSTSRTSLISQLNPTSSPLQAPNIILIINPNAMQQANNIKKPKLLVPPLNFAPVAEGVYRSGHPLEISYPFLENLKLKTILYFGDKPEEETVEYTEWAKSQNINLIRFHFKSVKEPFIQNDEEAITKGLEMLLDTRNAPVLVHSNKGKHRVGVLVGIMRKMLLGWSLAAIFDEYSKFAGGKGDADMEFIELYEPVLRYNPTYAPKWLRRVE